MPKAKVVLTSTAMVGSKELVTDTSGYFRFANLPPGDYTLTVTTQGFKTYKHEGITVGVGRLPSTDVVLQVGAESTTVEVSTEAPVIDTARPRTSPTLQVRRSSFFPPALPISR